MRKRDGVLEFVVKVQRFVCVLIWGSSVGIGRERICLSKCVVVKMWSYPLNQVLKIEFMNAC